MSDTPKHTPGPYQVTFGRRNLCHIETAMDNPHGAGRPICSVARKYEAEAIRMVACVNALEGLNPEAVRELVRLVERIRDEMQSASSRGDAVNVGWLDQRIKRLTMALAFIEEK